MLVPVSVLIFLLIIISTIYNYKKNSSLIFLAGFLIPIAIYGLVHFYSVIAKSAIGIVITYGHFMPLFFLPGPMLFFYIRSTLKDSVTKLKRNDLFHFVPFLIALTSIFPYYFWSLSAKYKVAGQIVDQIDRLKIINITWLYPNFINLVIRPFILLIYSVICLRIINQHKKTNQASIVKQESFIINWLNLLAILSIIISVGYSILTIQYILTNSVSNQTVSHFFINYLIAIAYACIPLLMLLFPSILYGIPIVRAEELAIENQAPTLNSDDSVLAMPVLKSLSPEDNFVLLAERILQHINNKKPYLDPKFNIDDISEKLNIPKHHVYYCFNNVINKKFTKIRTELRIEHAKKLLLSEEITISSLEGIWTKSGFSSKTSFFTSFKEETGMTPIEFIDCSPLALG